MGNKKKIAVEQILKLCNYESTSELKKNVYIIVKE